MSTPPPIPIHALVLYKSRPARVLSSAEKLEIDVQGGSREKVRPKDVLLLHPGPYLDSGQLARGPRQTAHPPEELAEVWELLEGEDSTLEGLSNLLFGSFTPTDAYWLWQYVQDTPYFSGTPEHLKPRSSAEIEVMRAEGQAREQEKRDWEALLERLRAGTYAPEDRQKLLEVESLALGKGQKSRILASLNHTESPEVAHALLLRIGLWNATRNPYPSRQGVVQSAPTLEMPPFADEARLDLTHLESYAIDDEGAGDPDDAISLEVLGEGRSRLWVHISDVAALVPPDSPLDLEARRRGATLYTPEKIVTMLPENSVELLGLGLSETSLALSIGTVLERGEDGGIEPGEIEIHPSRVRVTRLTYSSASEQLAEEPLCTLLELAHALERRREGMGAVQLRLPEVKIKVGEGQVSIKPIGSEAARPIVQEAMMLTGWAAATYALEQGLPFPYASQDVTETWDSPAVDLPEQFARRKTLGRTRWNARAGRHMGLGLEPYAQVTSPMRRYLDLVAHQQLRAFLREQDPIAVPALMERIGAAELASSAVRQAERSSNRHWTLVYLTQHPDWQGEAVVVDRKGALNILLIPELALEVSLGGRLEIGEQVRLEVAGVDLAALELRVRVLLDEQA